MSKIKAVPYPTDVACPPPRIPISFDEVSDDPLDVRLAFMMQLHAGVLDLDVGVADLGQMGTEEKRELLTRIEDRLGIPELIRHLEIFK